MRRFIYETTKQPVAIDYSVRTGDLPNQLITSIDGLAVPCYHSLAPNDLAWDPLSGEAFEEMRAALEVNPGVRQAILLDMTSSPAPVPLNTPVEPAAGQVVEIRSRMTDDSAPLTGDELAADVRQGAAGVTDQLPGDLDAVLSNLSNLSKTTDRLAQIFMANAAASRDILFNSEDSICDLADKYERTMISIEAMKDA